jgi:hypothetical protein
MRIGPELNMRVVTTKPPTTLTTERSKPHTMTPTIITYTIDDIWYPYQPKQYTITTTINGCQYSYTNHNQWEVEERFNNLVARLINGPVEFKLTSHNIVR